MSDTLLTAALVNFARTYLKVGCNEFVGSVQLDGRTSHDSIWTASTLVERRRTFPARSQWQEVQNLAVSLRLACSTGAKAWISTMYFLYILRIPAIILIQPNAIEC